MGSAESGGCWRPSSAPRPASGTQTPSIRRPPARRPAPPPPSSSASEMPATAFASSRPLAPDELESAPVRYPRPSRLDAPLKVEGQKSPPRRRRFGTTHRRRPALASAKRSARGTLALRSWARRSGHRRGRGEDDLLANRAAARNAAARGGGRRRRHRDRQGDLFQPTLAGPPLPTRYALAPPRQAALSRELQRRSPRTHERGARRRCRPRLPLSGNRRSLLHADPLAGARTRRGPARNDRATSRRHARSRASAGPRDGARRPSLPGTG